MIGTVKWFNPAKGFGFITTPGGREDVFVHHRNITPVLGQNFRTLNQGDEVTFKTELIPDKGMSACDVVVTKPAPAKPAFKSRLTRECHADRW